MYFDSFADFLNMGGHGLYVWLGYGVCFTALIVFIAYQRRRRRVVVAQLQRTFKRQYNAAAGPPKE